MENTTFYCGINSDTFFRGYNPDNQLFDKRGLSDMDSPDKLYLHHIPIKIRGKNWEILHNHCCGQLATRYAKKHGGLPLIFSVDGGTLSDYGSDIENESINGKLVRSHFILNPSVAKVKDIYVVKYHVKNLGAVIRKCESASSPKAFSLALQF